jgi:L-lactate dehydrogenase complex protein LldG
MSEAREAILQSIARARPATRPVPDYRLPSWTADPASHFIAKAKASVAQVHEIESVNDAPASIWAIMAEMHLPPLLHVPENSPINALPWTRAPGLILSAAPPDGNECAAAGADYGIAETGTLVFLSGPRSPSSWHFRPGCEFALVMRNTILPRFEDVIAILAAEPRLPATLNLITGPSRTADIEQTIELGAHGPRDVHILIAG